MDWAGTVTATVNLRAVPNRTWSLVLIGYGADKSLSASMTIYVDVNRFTWQGSGMKPYKAKSLKAAERAVRSLRKQRAERDELLNIFDELLNIFDREREMLAKLAAETPQFFNPLHVMEAKKIRDLILKQLTPTLTESGRQPKA